MPAVNGPGWYCVYDGRKIWGLISHFSWGLDPPVYSRLYKTCLMSVRMAQLLATIYSDCFHHSSGRRLFRRRAYELVRARRATNIAMYAIDNHVECVTYVVDTARQTTVTVQLFRANITIIYCLYTTAGVTSASSCTRQQQIINQSTRFWL